MNTTMNTAGNAYIRVAYHIHMNAREIEPDYIVSIVYTRSFTL